MTNAEGARWVYEYDSLGQVTSGKRYWSDGVPVAGQQFEYGYDDIGNREYAGEGGNEWGTNLRYEHYTVNTVNHYTQRTVPGYADTLGTAKPNSTVTVNDTPTYRKSDYFRGELPVTNSIGPIWISLTNLAVLKDGVNPDITTNFVGSEFVPKNPETFTYDLDGNQTSDGRWTNRWDGENRLISVESHSSAPDGSKYKIIFAYDSQWRRTSKIVSNWVSGAWALSKNIRFAYDGWNLIAELNATNNTVINSYLWGLDLSGTPQGAGGVGGLLAIKSTGNGTHFTAFDGNGNITALASVTNASVTAQYEYDPFLNRIRETGPMAKLNDFTGSTKRADRETGIYYYGYRYLRNGRWLSKDPIEEGGGLNLYSFYRNDAVNVYDRHGLSGCSCSSSCACKSVTFMFVPGNNQLQFGPMAEPDANSFRFGFALFVKWEVEGNPTKCKYFQRESGSISTFHIDGNGRTSHMTATDHQITPGSGRNEGRLTQEPCGFAYEDYGGRVFDRATESGKWLWSHGAITIKLECQSSDGTVHSTVAANLPPASTYLTIPQ